MKKISNIKHKTFKVLIGTCGLILFIPLVIHVKMLCRVYSKEGSAVIEKMDTLCKLNGGISVFEHASLENELLDNMRLPIIDYKYLRNEDHYSIKGTNYTLVTDNDHLLISPQLKYDKKNVDIFRHMNHLVRKSDNKIMATGISYSTSVTPLLNLDPESSDNNYWYCQNTNGRESTSHSDLRFYVFRPSFYSTKVSIQKIDEGEFDRWYSIDDFLSLDDPMVHFPFDSTLVNVGSATLFEQLYSDNDPAVFEKGGEGEALFTRGQGDSVEFKSIEDINLGRIVEISFLFQRKDWENPYEGSPRLQTIATLSAHGDNYWSHISFGFNSLDDLSFSVSFEAEGGGSCYLKTKKQAVTKNWHAVRLRINSIEKTTSLYIDGVEVDKQRCVPTAISEGINKIKFGTWYKHNQAYRGLIDDFIVKGKTY